MSKSISRAQFLRGDFSGKHGHIRPPWSKGERSFTGDCSRCDDCIKACPEQILSHDQQGFPLINFMKGECTFCGDCARACNTSALQFNETVKPWTLRADINKQCLPLQGVVCGRCAEECEVSAIRMKLVAGGISIPQFESEACNGCGACFRVCPTTAIELSYNGVST